MTENLPLVIMFILDQTLFHGSLKKIVVSRSNIEIEYHVIPSL